MKFDIEHNLGIAPDPRSEEEKAKDFKHDVPAEGVIVDWVEKTPDQWKHYTPREQDGSLSCCGQASAKAYEILTGVVMSAHPPYRSRANFPDGGMYLQDVGNVWKKVGSTKESLDISQWINESKMNLPISVATSSKIAAYKFPINDKSIDEVAGIIELYKHCILIVHCNKSEWTDIPEYNGGAFDFGHCICAVDYMLHDGKKVLLIEDSTGHFNSLKPKKEGQRLITEDFFVKRFDGAMYFVLEVPPPPFQFTLTLRIGANGNEVIMLQKVLNQQGSILVVDGKFGPSTFKAVTSFQALHHLTADGVVGPMTRAELNKLV